MKINLAVWDRVLRFILGFLLLTWVFAQGPFWAWIGLYFLLTSGFGYCPAYFFLRWKTVNLDALQVTSQTQEND